MTEKEPVRLEYAAPASRRGLAVGYHLLVMGAVGVLWLVVVFMSLFVTPRVEAVLKDFKTELPAITKCVLFASRLLGSWVGVFGLIFLLMAVVLVGIVVDASARDGRAVRRYAIAVLVLSLVLTAAYLVLVVLAYFLPMFALVRAVSGT